MKPFMFMILTSFILPAIPAGAMTIKPLGRQAVYLKPAVDAIDGNLMLRVTNPLDEPVDDTLPIMLPLQAESWEPLAGFNQEDVSPAKDGTGLVIRQRFEPGMKSFAVEFRLAALFGKSHITIPILYPVAQLSFFAKPGFLTFEDYPSNCSLERNSDFMGMNFDVLGCSSPVVSQNLTIVVSGVPEGRFRYLLLAGIFGFLLFVSGFVIAWVGRPRLDGGL